MAMIGNSTLLHHHVCGLRAPSGPHCPQRSSTARPAAAFRGSLKSAVSAVCGRSVTQRCRIHIKAADSSVTTALSTDNKSGSGGPSKKEEPWRWDESSDAAGAYIALASLLLVGALPAAVNLGWYELPYFVGLAVCTIYIGAHKGLTTEQRQQLSVKEGLLAPVGASVALFGCYLVIKYLPQFSLQTVLDIYFFVLGFVSVSGAAGPLLRKLYLGTGGKLFPVKVPEGWVLNEKGESVPEVELAPVDLLTTVLALGVVTADLMAGHQNYTLSNTIACLVASDIMMLLGLRNFRVAGIMLAGLLAYDVFWVFGSSQVVGDNVMLTVATSNMINAPTRLLFPKAMINPMSDSAGFPFSLLGLGDVALPGLLACLALRFDAHKKFGYLSPDFVPRIADSASTSSDSSPPALPATSAASGSDSANAASASEKTTNGEGEGDGEGAQNLEVTAEILQHRKYFTPVMGSYVVGLLIAFVINSITNVGQPALLYLVPCTLSAVLVTGAAQGELGKLWEFNDVPTFGMPETPKPEEK